MKAETILKYVYGDIEKAIKSCSELLDKYRSCPGKDNQNVKDRILQIEFAKTQIESKRQLTLFN